MLSIATEVPSAHTVSSSSPEHNQGLTNISSPPGFPSSVNRVVSKDISNPAAAQPSLSRRNPRPRYAPGRGTWSRGAMWQHELPTTRRDVAHGVPNPHNNHYSRDCSGQQRRRSSAACTNSRKLPRIREGGGGTDAISFRLKLAGCLVQGKHWIQRANQKQTRRRGQRHHNRLRPKATIMAGLITPA